MRSAYLGGVDVCEAVGAKLAVAVAINRAGHYDARVCGVAYAPDVFGRIGCVADERELHRSVHLLKRFAHRERVVFRLQTAHVEKVSARFQAEFCEGRGSVHFPHFGAVGNERAPLAVTLPVVILDGAGVGDYGTGTEGGEPFGKQIPGLRQAVPLLALPLDAIDVERYANPEQARPQREDGVGAVTVERDVL